MLGRAIATATVSPGGWFGSAFALRIWDLTSKDWEFQPRPTVPAAWKRLTGIVNSLLWADARHLLIVVDSKADGGGVSSGDGGVFCCLLDERCRVTNLERLDLQTHVSCMALEGNLAVSGSAPGTISVWRTKHRLGHLSTFASMAQLEGHSAQVTCVAFDVTSTRFASASRDASVRIWQTVGSGFKVWSCVSVLTPPPPRDVGLESGPEDDEDTEDIASQMASNMASLSCVAIKGRLVVAGSMQGSLFLWDSVRGLRVELETSERRENDAPVPIHSVLVDGGRILAGFTSGALRELRSELHEYRWRSCPHL